MDTQDLSGIDPEISNTVNILQVIVKYINKKDMFDHFNANNIFSSTHWLMSPISTMCEFLLPKFLMFISFRESSFRYRCLKFQKCVLYGIDTTLSKFHKPVFNAYDIFSFSATIISYT